MKNENSNILRYLLDSDLTLFDLKIKASQIKNYYSVKNSLNTLMDFVETRRLRFTNP